MPFNEKYIKEYSCQLYERISNKQYTFNDLQLISKLESSVLCLVIIQLIRENKMAQHCEEGRIYYRKC